MKDQEPGEILFDNISDDLKKLFKKLTPDDVRDIFGSKIFARGEDYYDSDTVHDVVMTSDKTSLTAMVEGNSDYEIHILAEHRKVTGSCNCPYGGMCKHQVAVLLFCINEPENIAHARSTEKKVVNYRDYLESLRKDELIGLVLDYAPKNFFIAIDNQFSGKEHAAKSFLKVKNGVQRLFTKTELLYDPSAFEETLLKQFDQLKGLEKLMKSEIGALIFYVVNEIEKSIDEGYLYTDDYNEEYFDSARLEEFIISYAKSLPFEEKINFMNEFTTVIQSQNYDTFSNVIRLLPDAFSDNDHPALKKTLLRDYTSIPNDLTDIYYSILGKELGLKEREMILRVLSNESSNRLLELAILLRNEKRIPEATDLLKKSIQKNRDDYIEPKIFMLYLDYLQEEGKDVFKPALDAISRCPIEQVMQKISSLRCVDIAACEAILEKKDPEEMLSYLESKGRLREGLALVSRSEMIYESRVYEFFKKYKKEFPSEALLFFRKIVEKNLKSTGDRYYHEIAGALSQISQLDATTVAGICKDIRTNYQRRRNLIKLISRF